MSAIFTILIYVADLLVIYVLSDSINFVFIAGCVIPAAMAVILLASFFGLRPKAIKKLRAADRKNIISAIDEIKSGAELIGIKLPKFKVSFNTSDSVNAYAAGFNAVIIPLGLIKQYGYDSRLLAAVIAHEIAHIKHHDCLYSCIIYANIIGISIGLSVTLFGASLIITILAAVVLSIIFSDIAALYLAKGFGKMIGKVVGFIRDLVTSVYYVFSLIFTRLQEYSADAYSARLGFAFELIYFLEETMNDEYEETTFWESVSSTHPSSYARIKRLEDIDAETETKSNSFFIEGK